MREIKFRAWDKLDKRMMYRGIFDKNWYATPYNDESGCHCIKGIVTEDRHNLDLMQLTGLLDKSGKEIYEGDIVHYDFTGVIVWDEICCWYSVISNIVKPPIRPYIERLFNDAECWKIIGNIYENSELLK